MVRVCMEGYVLPIVNELTGVVSEDLFVPIGDEFASHANWEVAKNGSLDDLFLEIKSHGPVISDVDKRRYETSLQHEFSKMYMKESQEAQSRRFRGTSSFADAAAASVFMAGAGSLAIEHLPSITGFGELGLTLHLGLVAGIFCIQGMKYYRDARTKKHIGTIADHFSTDLRITQGDDGLTSKVMELYAYFETLDGTSKQVNRGMAKKAQELGLPAVKAFYESRMSKRRVAGILHKIFSQGFLHVFAERFTRWYKDDDMGLIERIGEQVGTINQRSSVNVFLPVTLLPSFDGYDVFVGHRDQEGLRDLAMRAGDGLDVGITFEVSTSSGLSEGQREHLEAHLSNAIHDNIYRMARIFTVLPKEIVKTESSVGKYASITGGIVAAASGVATMAAGLPFAGSALYAGGVYLISRPLLFTKPLEHKNKLMYERLIRGHDMLQERLDKTDAFKYINDPALCVFENIMKTQDTPYAAYTACVDEAKRLNRPDDAAHYIHKALSVQPMDRELRPGVMELLEGKE